MDYKPIVERIASLQYDSLLQFLFEILKRQEADRSRPAPFWHPLLLLRWSMEFAETTMPSKPATMEDMNWLFKQIDALERAHATFDLKRNGRVSKTFTILAFQQFQYQEKPWFDTFQRQYILYCALKGTHDINLSFQSKTGLVIVDLLLAFKIFWMSILHDAMPAYVYRGIFTNQHMSLVGDLLGYDRAAKIFDLLSVSRERIKSVIEQDRRLIRDYNLQVFEPSIFSSRPFFEYRDKLMLPHRDILNHTLNHFIYDFMKSRDDKFAEDLGGRLEKYVELGLRENEIPFIAEQSLKKRLRHDSKVVDFLIEDDVLLECKAIELRPYANINPTDEILSTEMAKTITKAYARQMMETIRGLNTDREYFGVIVTYKKLNLGETEDIWEQFLARGTDAVAVEAKIRAKLPYKNLFFIDLASWDLVMQICKTHNLGLRAVLINTLNAPERKFGFHMHLDEYGIRNYDLRYLQTGNQLLDQ